MTDKEQLFFELLRVSIGGQDALTRIPTEREWEMLYKMASKQSLIGVCFAGLQRLGADADTGFEKIGMSEMLYLDWMGMAYTIQTRNEEVNRQCAEVQETLLGKGMRSCVLKGQSAAMLYSPDLRMLRQSGDIDVWVDAGRKDIIEMVQSIAPTSNVREHHLELRIFPETEVEVHYWPAVIRHFVKNRRLQRWFDGKRDEVFANRVENEDVTLCSPTPEFHAIQMMAHMYHHLFDSGIGLRQVMDYYFVLEAIASSEANTNHSNVTNSSCTSKDSVDLSNSCSKEIHEVIKHIGMGRFASAMMYVLQETMGLSREKMICEPNEENGKFLLGEILRGGNFGKYDTKKTRNTKNYFSSFVGGITRNFRHLRFNPFDWFWSPLWRLYYFGWRKIRGWR